MPRARQPKKQSPKRKLKKVSVEEEQRLKLLLAKSRREAAAKIIAGRRYAASVLGKGSSHGYLDRETADVFRRANAGQRIKVRKF